MPKTMPINHSTANDGDITIPFVKNNKAGWARLTALSEVDYVEQTYETGLR
jgi:hypothetical protein